MAGFRYAGWAMKVPFGVIYRLHFPSEKVVRKRGAYEETLVHLLT
jgi:hypothetical protein